MSYCIYLAGAIDGLDEEGTLYSKKWREEMPYSGGIAFYTPAHAFIGAESKTSRSIDLVNRLAIVGCDGLIGNFLGPGKAFGSAREVEFARSLGKPVAIVGEIVSLTAHDVDVFRTFEEAVEAILDRLHAALLRPTKLIECSIMNQRLRASIEPWPEDF